jgi:hypothetical protein
MAPHIQQSTSGGSIVISTEPTQSSGVASVATNTQNAVRGPASRARKRSTMKPMMAASSGEQNRTPNSVSPPMSVPIFCSTAMPRGLL